MHTINLTTEELTSLQELIAWCDENAPRGLPLPPEHRVARLLLVKLEPVSAKLVAASVPAEDAKPEPVAEVPASA